MDDVCDVVDGVAQRRVNDEDDVVELQPLPTTSMSQSAICLESHLEAEIVVRN